MTRRVERRPAGVGTPPRRAARGARRTRYAASWVVLGVYGGAGIAHHPFRMQGERRASPRFPLILAVQYVGADTVLDYTENLSASGLFIRTEREFAVGERVKLVVSFPQLVDPVELEVEVVRCREELGDVPSGVAVRVPDDRPADRAKLVDVARVVAGSRGPEPSSRILLVEDNALVASIYTAALRRLSEEDHLGSFAIEVAQDGADALGRLLRAPPIDVLVTDVHMPTMTGVTLVEKIRAERSLASLPVVVVSGSGGDAQERLEALGVAAFLRKPVPYAELASVLRSVVAARSPGGDRARRELTEATPMPTNPSDAKPAYRR